MRGGVIAVWFLLFAAAASTARADLIPVQSDGTVYAVIVDCRACSEASKRCSGGVTGGFHDGKPCGKCLLEANYKVPLEYPYDLMLKGRILDEEGKPLAGRFVRLYMSTTWRVRTRTGEDGVFRMRLGATAPHKSGKSLVVDLGDRLLGKDGPKDEYALYMLPPKYQQCADASAD